MKVKNLTYTELTEKQKVIVKEGRVSLLNGESVVFNENNIDYEIYINNDGYYNIEKFI